MKFSLLMSVYPKDNSELFRQALQSILVNSLQPAEVVLVCDGPLTIELEKVIDYYDNKFSMILLKLNENVGLGRALQLGIKHCHCEWVARFDADDICSSNRFANQVAFIEKNSSIDIVGGQIIEFDNDPNDIDACIRQVPTDHNDIYNYARLRNPINHMTVMFKRSAVLEAGNYQHAPLYEDYDLWVRMLMKGYKFANMNEILVYARAGDKMYQRRGGLSYARQETVMQYSFYKLGFLSSFQLIKNVILRIPIRLVPSNIRKAIYSKLLR